MDLEILHNRCWIGNFFWALSSTPNPKTNFCQAQGLWNQILQFKGNFRLTRIQTFTRCRSTYPMISSPCPLTTYLSATLPLPLILPGTLTPPLPWAACSNPSQHPLRIFYWQTPYNHFEAYTVRRHTSECSSCWRICVCNAFHKASAFCLTQNHLVLLPEHFNTTLQVANWNVQSCIAVGLNQKKEWQ